MNLPEINILAILPALIVALTGVVVMVVDPFIDRSSRGKLGWLGFAGILGAFLALRPMSANRGFWYADLWWVDDYAIFFHANLLHRSDQNRSEHPRWSLICCYNARRNSPYKESRHPAYTPLEKVGDEAIMEWQP